MSAGHGFRWLAVTLSAIASAGIVAACSSDGPASCAAMRSELASLPPAGATQAWNDINELQKTVARGMKLKAEIADRCE